MTKQNQNKSGYKKTKMGWTPVKLKDVLCYERPDKYIVKSTEYTDKGLVPVLTANKSFILGYTNEDYGIYRKYPAIIFDDFTTESKYVDFPFKVKSSAIKILKPKDDGVDLKFIYERMQLIKFPLGGHKRYYISEYQYNKIPLPPLPEQQKIARILSTWDKAIELVGKLIDVKRRLKKGLMQQLLTGKMRFREFRKNEWSRGKLGDFFMIIAGQSKSKYIKEKGKFFVVDMGAISREGRLIANKRTDYNSDFLDKGDLVMPKDDIGGGNIIGKVAFINEDGKYILGDHVYRLKCINGDSLFFSFLINSYPINKSLRRKANGTAQLGLSKKDVESQKMVIPPINEQRKIANILNSFDVEIEHLKNYLEKLKQQKKGLMQKLLTGKIRVTV